MPNLACIIVQNDHHWFCIPTASQHRPASQAVLRGDVWEPETIRFLMENVGVGDVVHAGTYFGDALPALSASVSATAKVWAFEPNPESFAAAQITCRLNRLDNVELRNVALGASSGSIKLRVRDGTTSLGGLSRVLRDGSLIPDGDLETVSVVALDCVIPSERRVSVVHLDVEGFEDLALSGAVKLITAWCPVIVLETVPNKWASDHLAQLGYRVAGRCDENTILLAY